MSRLTLSTGLASAAVLLFTLYLLFQHTTVIPKHYFPQWSGSAPNGHDSRLSRTLVGNEQRYQEAVANRYKLMKDLGGSSIPAFPDPHTKLYTLWDFFVPAFSCPFPVYRVGTLGDGGKWVCGLERVLDKPNCVVYSMGVEQQSSFEESVLERFSGCQIYGFDYSVANWGPQLLAKPSLLSRAHFFPYLIGGVDDHQASPKVYSMQGIMEENGHQFVDILKMDIEGSEFSTLVALINSFEGRPLPFGQLQLEIHFGYTANMHTVGDFDKWWTVLEAAGLRAFWTEPNLMHANNFRSAPSVAEWCFLNIRGRHALTDDTLADYP